MAMLRWRLCEAAGLCQGVGMSSVCDGSDACDGDREVTTSAEGKTRRSNAAPEILERGAYQGCMLGTFVVWSNK